MVAEIFKGRNPTVHIGGDYPGFKNPAGGSEFFITEACEYHKSFLKLYPDFSLILNTELDHTDYYRGPEEYFAAFCDFAGQSEKASVLGDDDGLFCLAQCCGYATFGLSGRNDYTVKNVVKTACGRKFDICEKGALLVRAELNIPGAHNVLNALAAATAARAYGVSAEEIAAGLGRFQSVGRRFEFLGSKDGTRVYSDYAHHPTELAAMIASAREVNGGKLAVVFEPHTYTRTQSLYREFARSLSAADEVILAPVYASRDKPVKGVTSRLILEEMKRLGYRDGAYERRYEDIFERLKKSAGKNGVIVFAGAGTVDEFAREFVSGQ
ncbi:MAG: Mur ligase family protein [Firmicutes bacterium]|nr:Mur ligase family protein [Bacillota bacterium]